MADNLNQAVIAHIKATGLVAGRVWVRDHFPQNPTYPCAVVDYIGDQNQVLTGDAQQVSYWQQQIQISVFQDGVIRDKETGKMVNRYDVNLPGQMFRSFRAMDRIVGNHRITVRLRSINNIPQPDEDLVKQDSMTIEITRTLEAI